MRKVKVKSLDHLKRILKDLDGGMDFGLMLNGGLVSRKHVSHDGETFYVTNYIDSSYEELTDREIMDRGFTNIGYGIGKGAFYWENDDD